MRSRLGIVASLLLCLSAAVAAQPYQPPRHTAPPPIPGASPADLQAHADAGMQIERSRSAAGELDEHRRLDAALKGLQPQRRGTVDAYVVSIALDSDPVFGREARAAGQVLERRYAARGRSIVLAGTDGSAPSRLPRGTPASLAVTLARIAELMDKNEDVLVLYATGHGTPLGLYYNDADNGYGLVSPNRLAGMLDELGLTNRLIILSACYSGGFVPRLQSATSVIVAAAAHDRTSFGCVAENDWTFFGDAMVNHALRGTQPLAAAFEEASTLIMGWEAQLRFVPPSAPQLFLGIGAARWLGPLEQRLPPATAPTGRPALETTRATLQGR
ncbi:MAG TPA: C13 family peptidase [Allosphingosinicella sp.]|nr:C13 family peptidase [Allosphingosinicella sp.]